ncbi:MAG: hypothetical protein M1133_14260 [Armatimonadetes bacterium]|nr:hypothetical protein [Armatimonadota bacterium]
MNVNVKTNLLVLCGIVSMGTACGADTPKQKTLHYELKVKSASFGDMGSRKMWIKGDKMRWEAKTDRFPLCLVKNKQGVFLIHPWNKYAAKYPDGSSRGNPSVLFPGPTGPVPSFLAKVKATKHGTQKVAKELCNVYTYTDPVTRHQAKMWVGVKSGKPVQLLLKGERGKADTITAAYTKFELGAKAPDSLFELPKGYAIRPMPAQKLTSKATAEKPKTRKSG